MDPWIVFAAVLALGGLLWLANHYLDKRRRSQLQAFAESMGIEYHETLPAEDRGRFSVFPLARKGHSQRIGASLVIDDGETRIVLFDFVTVSGNGKNKSTKYYSLALISNDATDAPAMEITPKTWSTKFTNLFGRKSIAIESNPVFSSSFSVFGDSPEEVQRFLTSPRTQTIAEGPIRTLATFRHSILLTHSNVKLKPKNVRKYLSNSVAFEKAFRQS